jgi:two-component system, NtrC family, response regulator AtoC
MNDVQKKVLVVDDEASIRDSLRLLLKTNFSVSVAEDGETALEMFDELAPDLVLLDVIMPKLDGLETLKRLRSRNPQVPVIMLTATTTVKTAVQAMKAGAVDYLNKPFEIEELTSLIVDTLDRSEFKPVQRTRLALVAPEADCGVMVGKSATMLSLFAQLKQVAERNTTVLITGESGTGKELVARRIHDLSARKNGPFTAINCAAIPETLIESELFGHEKGAFTHAVDRRLGHFELADGGTLFLDEIGELSLPVQVKMLRFLQEQEFYRIGRAKPIKVDVRIIAATNKNLEDLIAEKRFRQDLFYRINVINLAIPPLRDRFEDIPYLTESFVRKFAPVYGNKTITFTPDALEVLVQYDWPGNVRELENVVESLMALLPGETVTEAELPRKLKVHPKAEALKFGSAEGEIKFDDAEKMFETEMIIKALKKTNYVQTRAAELLGISRRILKYKMDKLGIGDAPPPVSPGGNVPSDVNNAGE